MKPKARTVSPSGPDTQALKLIESGLPTRRDARYTDPVPLEEALRIAAESGVPLGIDAANGRWDEPQMSRVARDILRSPYRDRLIDSLHQLLVSEGIPDGKVIPYLQGAFTTTFRSPDTREIVKLTASGADQFRSPADGVWGVLSPRVAVDLAPGQRSGVPDLALGIAPEAVIGAAKNGDRVALSQALRDQGWDWFDDHMGNMGMLPGSEYRPVVIDASDVYPRETPAKRSFTPPTGPFIRSLIPALAAAGGGAAATANASIPWAGQSQAGLGGSLPNPPPSGTKPEWWFDGSMSISPTEWRNWENVPEYGYGGDEHRQYVSEMQKALDVPSIPQKYVEATIGQPFWKRVFPGYEGGDMTMRQFLAGAPEAMALSAILRGDFADADQIHKSTEGERRNMLVNDAWSALTGTAHSRDSPVTQRVVAMTLDGIRSGTPGQQFADPSEWSQSEFDALQAEHGEKANAMLPPGGVNNHRRLAVYELASALQDGEHAPKASTTTQAIGNFLAAPFTMPGTDSAHDKFYEMMDTSAPRGRIQTALGGWERVKGRFIDNVNRYAPPAVDGGFMAYDPRTWDGWIEQRSNPSLSAFGRNVHTPWNAVVGDIGSAASLLPKAVAQDGPAGITKPFQFLADTADRQRRIAKIVPDGVTQKEFRDTGKWSDQWNNAQQGYWSASLGPIFRGYLPNVADSAINAPQQVLKDPAELASTAIPALTAGRLATVGKEVLEESGEEVTQGPVLNALLEGDVGKVLKRAIERPETSPYILPRADGSNPHPRDRDYWDNYNRSQQEWGDRLNRQYDQWNSRQPRVRVISGVPQPNAG